MGDYDVDALVRKQRQRQSVGRDARCERCRDTRHLSKSGGQVLCYACRRTEHGADIVERDHIAGRANLGGLLIDLRANDHRTVTEIRLGLGVADWPSADGDPLLVLAHVLGGVASLLFLFAQWLVALAAHLAKELGDDRWATAPPHPVLG